MKRRDFLATSAVAGLALTQAEALVAADKDADKAILELRTYSLETAEKQAQLIEVLDTAAIPAWNRLGIEPVGIFTAKAEDNPLKPNGKGYVAGLEVFVLLPHKSLESVLTANRKLMEDAEYVAGAQPIWDGTKNDPLYARIESNLLVAFDGCPQVEVPSTQKGRILQLRCYESHNAERGYKKIDMFNLGGEIEVFRRCGMTPVFFGESIVGTKIPNLTYMLGFDSPEAGEEAWAKFREDPKWKALSGDEQYKDTVSNITNIFVRPTPGSQI